MKKFIIAIAVLFSFTFAVAGNLTAQESLDMTYGGQLYDKWYAMTPGAQKPSATHAAYPSSAKKSGADTWRCKECHGWDLKGKDGGYAKGSHYTGIKGLQAYADKPLADIIAVINNDAHALKGLLGEKELNALALFVSKSQIDLASHMDGKRAKGDRVNGAKLFNGICASCHGIDGRLFEIGSKHKSVGDLVRDNSIEIAHKIRFGNPGANMSYLHDLPLQVTVDILDYAYDLK